MQKLQDILAAPVKIDELIEKLDFSEENVVQANREQASLFLEASRYRVKKMRARIRTESAFETAKTTAAMFLRKKKKVAEKGTITEGFIRDQVATNPSVIETRKQFEDAQVYEEWSKSLVAAYSQRAHAIRTLAEILGAEASAQARMVRKDLEEAGFEQLKKQVRKRFPGRHDE
jgi:uridine phosphorylase